MRHRHLCAVATSMFSLLMAAMCYFGGAAEIDGHGRRLLPLRTAQAAGDWLTPWGAAVAFLLGGAVFALLIIRSFPD